MDRGAERDELRAAGSEQPRFQRGDDSGDRWRLHDDYQDDWRSARALLLPRPGNQQLQRRSRPVFTSGERDRSAAESKRSTADDDRRRRAEPHATARDPRAESSGDLLCARGQAVDHGQSVDRNTWTARHDADRHLRSGGAQTGNEYRNRPAQLWRFRRRCRHRRSARASGLSQPGDTRGAGRQERATARLAHHSRGRPRAGREQLAL